MLKILKTTWKCYNVKNVAITKFQIIIEIFKEI